MAGKAKKPDYQVEDLNAMPSWKFRRRAVFMSLIFAGAVIAYVAFRWEDTQIAQTLVLGAFALIGAIVAAYIGGATYQDVKLWQPMRLTNSSNIEENQ
jgi:disulfide bond formation protein DsbB